MCVYVCHASFHYHASQPDSGLTFQLFTLNSQHSLHSFHVTHGFSLRNQDQDTVCPDSIFADLF